MLYLEWTKILTYLFRYVNLSCQAGYGCEGHEEGGSIDWLIVKLPLPDMSS